MHCGHPTKILGGPRPTRPTLQRPHASSMDGPSIFSPSQLLCISGGSAAANVLILWCYQPPETPVDVLRLNSDHSWWGFAYLLTPFSGVFIKPIRHVSVAVCETEVKTKQKELYSRFCFRCLRESLNESSFTPHSTYNRPFRAETSLSYSSIKFHNAYH